MPEALARIARARVARRRPDPGRRRAWARTTPRRCARRARRCSSPGARSSATPSPPRRLPAARAPRARMSIERRARARRRGGRATATRTRRSARSSSRGRRGRRRGRHEPAGGPHAEIIALDAAGERARGATLYVTMEPCAHHGRTPPCADAIVAAGVARVVAGCLDPNPEAGGGLERLRAAGVDVELLDLAEARARTRPGGPGSTRGRPYVILKLAVSLDGRVVVPGARWVTGEESRRRVHELRASVDAVARRDGHRARRCAAARRARRRASSASRAGSRSAAARCRRAPSSSSRSGPLARRARALAAEGVQSLLLEGGPTLAASFLAGRPRRPAARLRRARARGRRARRCSGALPRAARPRRA